MGDILYHLLNLLPEGGFSFLRFSNGKLRKRRSIDNFLKIVIKFFYLLREGIQNEN